MSFFIPDCEIDRIIEEDVNPVDLTSFILGMDKYNAQITYQSRSDLVVCCTEEVERIFNKLGIAVSGYSESGTEVKENEIFFSAEGRADRIHMAWRNGVRMFESFSGISTRTRSFTDKARKVNPAVNIVTTRKCPPGTKKLITKAVMSGGAFPHRLGLSESVLFFDPHVDLFGGREKIIENIAKIRNDTKEKKLGIEAHDTDSALKFAEAGFDCIQLDKFTAEEIETVCRTAKRINPNVTLCAAGNITMENVEEIAATGVDVIVTSSLYFGPPADIKAVIRRV
ncbi:MAG: ModD protein [Spirochaetes bacterium]|nr:ModD protein [Spirochaetota bacterium]